MDGFADLRGLTGMNDLRYIKRLKVLNDYKCERGVNQVTKWHCSGCKYLYYGEYSLIHCIKREIRDWTLYRIENCEENNEKSN